MPPFVAASHRRRPRSEAAAGLAAVTDLVVECQGEFGDLADCQLALTTHGLSAANSPCALALCTARLATRYT